MLLNKVNIAPILKAHFATLTDARTSAKYSVGDLVLFFGSPAFISLAPLVVGFRFRIDAVNGFLNVFAVLTGLLLNLLVLVVTLSTTKPPNGIESDFRAHLVREVFANACFAVGIAVAVVCTALIALSYMRSNPGATTGLLTTFALVYLTVNFLLTLAMVMKRMFQMLDREMR